MLCLLRRDQPEHITGDRSPGRRKRGLLEDLALLLEPAHLTTQPPQLLTLLAGQALGPAGVDLLLLANRFVRRFADSSATWLGDLHDPGVR